MLTAVVAVLALASACTTAGAGTTPKLEPKVAPPVIAKAGVLSVAVDETYPPFAAVVDGELVGLDVDVASALAERLGLTLRTVSVPATGLASAVRDGKADIALGGVAMTEQVLADAAFAGSYVTDGPVFFSTEATSLTLAALAGRRVAVQEGSAAYWTLRDELGPDALSVQPTLYDALSEVASGTADVAAGDAVVGAYLLRDMRTLRFSGQLGSAAPLGVMVSKENAELEAVVRDALDTIATNGVLTTIQRKWLGTMPALEVQAITP